MGHDDPRRIMGDWISFESRVNKLENYTLHSIDNVMLSFWDCPINNIIFLFLAKNYAQEVFGLYIGHTISYSLILFLQSPYPKHSQRYQWDKGVFIQV